jgi:nucleotide-binding universal stress UspA family protein
MGYEAPILVGLDQSEEAAEALRWAAWQSGRTAAPLVAVHAYRADPDLRERPGGDKAEENLVRARATQWIRNALSGSSILPWRTQLVVTEGSASQVLVDRSDKAGMLVVGTSASATSPRGRAGSVSAVLPGASRCPVVSVPAPAPGQAQPSVPQLLRDKAQAPSPLART